MTSGTPIYHIANPNATTGIALGLDKIEQLLNQNRDRLVVVDEAYVDFGGESAIALLPEYDNLLVIRTMSKSRSLAGARVGFAIGNKDLIADMNAMRFSFNPYNINRLSLLAAEKAAEDVEYFEDCCRKIIENRAFLTEELRKRGFAVLDSKTNFVFAKSTIGGKAYLDALRAKGILVRWFSSERLRDYVRITIGTREEMEELVRATDDILREANQ